MEKKSADYADEHRSILIGKTDQLGADTRRRCRPARKVDPLPGEDFSSSMDICAGIMGLPGIGRYLKCLQPFLKGRRGMVARGTHRFSSEIVPCIEEHNNTK